jgi:hypothetical protein
MDYVLVKDRFRNSIKNVVTLPVAGILSDSKLLDAKLCIRVKKFIKLQKVTKKECGQFIAQRQKVDFIEKTILHSDIKVGLWKCSRTKAIQLC